MTDKAGRPYIEHVARVADGVKGNKDAETAAWLHDVVEDTEVTLLTHDKNVPYMEYINGLKNNEIARSVKIADLKDNMDLSRFDEPSRVDRERAEKYKEVLRVLEADVPFSETCK
ncbi:MAG: GTP pyrophosphokinase [Eubacteriaceae bacterium]|nr:GTP pyrophosphokinase [Eubacteriaceae bacterium]